jgi:hypothetical protein
MALFPLGILSAAGAGGPLDAYEQIATTILGSNAASISFDVSSLGSTYRHLQLRMVTRTNRTAGTDGLRIRLNSDTGANYSIHSLGGNGSSVQCESFFNAANQTAILVTRTADANSGTNIFGSAVLDFLDPFSTTKNKTIRALHGLHTSSFLGIHLTSGAWYNTAATTNILIFPEVGSQLVTGTRISLYGIRG